MKRLVLIVGGVVLLLAVPGINLAKFNLISPKQLVPKAAIDKVFQTSEENVANGKQRSTKHSRKAARDLVEVQEDLELFTCDDAVSAALAADLNLQKAQKELEVAASELGIQQRWFTVEGRINYAKKQNLDPQNALDQNDSLTSGVVLDSGGKWALSAEKVFSNDTLIENETGTLLGLNYKPFSLTKDLNTLTKKSLYYNKIYAFEAARIDLIIRVRKAYAKALQKKSLFELTSENLKLTKVHLDHTKSLFKAGKVAKLNLLEAKQEVKAAENELIKAKLEKEAALLSLGLIVGQNHALQDFTLDKKGLYWAETKAIDPERTMKRMVSESPELKLAEVNLALKEKKLRNAQLYHLANLELGVSYFKPDNPSAAGINQQTKYSVGISGPLDNLLGRQLSNTQKEKEAAGLSLEDSIKEQQLKIIDTLRQWKTTELMLGPMKDSVEISKEKLRIVTIKYNNGMASGSDVINERRLMNGNEKAYWQSWLNMQFAREEFYRTVWGKPVFKDKIN